MTLDQKIDPVLLQQAVDQAMPRFPTFKVAMRKGLFWRYLEPNHRPGPFVQEDIANPCMPMSFKGRSRYLVRFYYYENEISLEMFHSLSDGNGGMCLLKTVAAQYLRLQGSSVSCGEGVMDLNEEPDPEELEDAYARYARSRSRSALRQKKAYRVRGTREPFYTLNVIRGVIPVGQALKVAKSYGVSLTEYLNGALIYALMRKQKSENPAHQKPIKLAMPVNLRNLFPHYTVLKNIMDAPVSVDKVPREEARQQAMDLLAQLGLSDKADAYPYQLSGGQQQRVSIARALALKPKILFFDEPTSALDPELTGEVLKVIRQLAKDHMTMIIVTHEMQFARELSDRIIFMEDGVIRQQGTPEELFMAPDARVKEFIGKFAG